MLDVKLLPASVIQSIIEDFQSVHDISQSHLRHSLDEDLSLLGITVSERNNVLDVLKSNYLFHACNPGALKTDVSLDMLSQFLLFLYRMFSSVHSS